MIKAFWGWISPKDLIKSDKSDSLEYCLDSFFELKLNKNEENPRHLPIGYKHPEQDRVIKWHAPGVKGWYSNKKQSQNDDDFVTNNKSSFLEKVPESHKKTVHSFIEKIQSHPKRHAIAGMDPKDGKMEWNPRIRHIKHLIRGDKNATINYKEDGSLDFSLGERHGKDGLGTSWNFHPEKGLSFLGRLYEGKLYKSDESGRFFEPEFFTRKHNLGSQLRKSNESNTRASSLHNDGLRHERNIKPRAANFTIKQTPDRDLAKAPYIDEHNTRAASNLGPRITGGAENSKIVNTFKIGKHTVHHWQHDDGDSFVVHDKYNPKLQPIASINVDRQISYPEMDEKFHDNYYVQHAAVHPDWSGKGFGRAAYKAAIKHFGTLQSSTAMSPKSDEAWKKLSSHPQIDVDFGVGDDEPHVATYRAFPKKLAANELAKAPMVYEDVDGFSEFSPIENQSLDAKIDLPNGFSYHRYKDIRPSGKYGKAWDYHHHLLDNKGEKVAEIRTLIGPTIESKLDSPKGHQVKWSQVKPDHTGKGYGKMLMGAIALNSKMPLVSDTTISPNAQKAWKSFTKMPGFGGKISPFTTDYKKIRNDFDKYNERHVLFVRDKNKAATHLFRDQQQTESKKLAASELAKAIHLKDFKPIQASHSKGVTPHIDHESHIANFPAHERYKDHISAGPVVYKKRKTGRGPDFGISTKIIHDISHAHYPEHGTVGIAPETYMTKPYHGHLESCAKSYTKHPIKGWATLTAKDILHSAGMGHMAEDVSAHIHENIPVTVHKFSEKHEPFSIPHVQKIHQNDLGKIAIMDFLTGNNDRHIGNIMISHKPDNEGNYSPLLIDHERNFQYTRTVENKFGKINHLSKDHPLDIIKNSALRYFADRRDIDLENVGYDLAPWWKEHGNKIKDTFQKNLQHIKDPDLKSHIENNFNKRLEWLNDHLIINNGYGIFNLRRKSPFEHPVPELEGVSIDHFKRARKK
jgi:GNAT superfamily N-acetyltransferase